MDRHDNPPPEADLEADEVALPPGKLYRLAWFFYLALAVGGVVWIGAREGTIPLSLFVDPSGWWLDLLLGLAAGLGLIGIWRALTRWIPSGRQLERRLARVLGRLEPAEVVALTVLSGFGEELFFRGAMQGSWGLPAATIVFAVLHSGPGKEYRVWTLFATLAGALFGLLMLWRGNLLAPVVAHMVVNGVNLSRLEGLAQLDPDADDPDKTDPDGNDPPAPG